MIQGILLVTILSPAQGGQTGEGKPPWDVFAVSTEYRFEILNDPVQERYVEARIRVATASKALIVSWWASADDDAADAYPVEHETVSFYPTAMDRSWEDLDRFYVAGRIFDSTKLEKWTIGTDYSLAVATDPATGIQRTLFDPPTITREPMLVDPAMQNVSSLTVNPWPPGGGTEEVWLFEWETRDVWVTNQSTGLRELRVPSTIAGPYRTISMIKHSSYGAVCRFMRAPWGRQASIVDENNDLDFLVTYDQDFDGQFDASETITFDDQNTHPMYTSGTFSVPWEDEL